MDDRPTCQRCRRHPSHRKFALAIGGYAYACQHCCHNKDLIDHSVGFYRWAKNRWEACKVAPVSGELLK